MLGSAVVSQISVEDLTFAASFIQSRTFRAFEVYLITTLIYLMLAILMRFVLTQVGRWVLDAGALK
jgi:polar amino acid transport system permease protein